MWQHIKFSGTPKAFILMNVHLRYIYVGERHCTLSMQPYLRLPKLLSCERPQWRKVEGSFVQPAEPLSSRLQSPHFTGSKPVTDILYSGTALTDTGGTKTRYQ